MSTHLQNILSAFYHVRFRISSMNSQTVPLITEAIVWLTRYNFSSQFELQGAAMPEAELGVEQLVDELLQFIILHDSLSTSPNRPWKVVKCIVVMCNLNRD
jgi:hypothetical protein